MKLNKTFFLIYLIYFLLTSIIFSQSMHFDGLIKNVIDKRLLLSDKEQIYNFDINKIIQNSPSTDGSPFNRNTNSQIDSVILIKIDSNKEDTLKYFYAYDSLGNVATRKYVYAYDSLRNIDAEERIFSTLTSNFYDSIGNLTSSIVKKLENEQWINSSQDSNVYNSSGNRSLHLERYWEDTIWVAERQVKYFYNSHEDMTSYLSEDWDGSKWVNSFRRTNTFDSNYYLISSLFQNWGVTDWTGYTWRESYKYDSNGNVISLLSENLNENEWENTVRLIYEYDKKEDNVFYFYQEWNGSEWISYERYTLTYDNNRNLIFLQKEIWKSIKWINDLQTRYIYNTIGDLSSAKTERWWDNNWIPGNNTVWMYDFDGNSRHYFGSNLVVYYATLTDLKNEELHIEDYSLSQNYPNPFNTSTIINYTIPIYENHKSSIVRLAVYNLLGQEVVLLVNKEQGAGSYNVTFDAVNLSSGVYFYNLHVSISSATYFNKTKKIVLLK